MPTINDFFREVDEAFGFYFDMGMACHIAKARLEKFQQENCIGDDSPFMYKAGPPEDDPEAEVRKALHATTFSSLKDRLADDGSDMLRAADAVIVIVYHIWEEKYRRTLTSQSGVALGEISSDIMGDLRLLRNSIIHNKGIAGSDVGKCKVIQRFAPGDAITLTKSDMNEIIRAIKSELRARL